MSLGVDW